MSTWKNVPGFEEYMVSSDGEVKSFKNGKETILKSAELYKTGYRHVSLWNNNKQKTYTVHRLVALTFIPNPENKPEINHIDGDRKNNHLSNLEWVTRSENMKHTFKVLGTKGGGFGKFGKDASRSVAVEMFDLKTGETIESFGCILDAHKKYPKASNISAACSGKRPSADGHGWRYINA